MNVASLELSKELFDLSKWNKTYLIWRWYTHWPSGELTEPELVKRTGHGVIASPFKLPAYDLGYLRESILDGLGHGTCTEEEYTEIIESLADALIRGEVWWSQK